jgi:RNA-binding protein YlmH
MNPTEIPSQQLTERTGSVASVRLDNIVSAATGLSRTKSAELIRQGAVIADHEEKNSVSFLCRDEMILTVRGYGKFRLGIPENSFTKKGKQKIIIYKYV